MKKPVQGIFSKGVLIVLPPLVILLATLNPQPCTARQQGPCEPFFMQLSPFLHDTLILETGTFTSLFDNSSFAGCEVRFESRADLMGNSSLLPSFYPGEETDLYAMGWRPVHEYTGDGPGSGIYGMIRDQTLCLVSWSQHAWLNDRSEIEVSNEILVTVQCMDTP